MRDTWTSRSSEQSRSRRFGLPLARELDDLVERERVRRRELIVAAVFRRLVAAPAHERRPVAEAAALQVVELHLADELGLERRPRRVLVARPPARSARRAALTEARAAFVRLHE